MRTARTSIILLVLLIPLAIPAFGADAKTEYTIALPDPIPDPMAYGLSVLKDSLNAAGAKLSTATGAPDINLTVSNDDDRLSEGGYSFYYDGLTLQIGSADPVGAMYALFQLAEDVDSSSGEWEPTAVKQRVQNPFLQFRAENLFLTLEKDGSISPWFYEKDFWERYIPMLARNRYNVLDIHAMYGIHRTYFPNIFPYFVYYADSPEAFRDPEEIKRNVEMLNWIVDYASQHGIRVGIMNYLAEFANLRYDRFAEKVLERVDDNLDFDWGKDAPIPELGNNFWAARWTGTFENRGPAPLKMRVLSDDGVRIWVNDEKVVDHWDPHPAMEDEFVIEPSHDPIPFEVEYFEHVSEAILKLEMLLPDGSYGRVPGRLFSQLTGGPGLKAEYYRSDNHLEDVTRYCVREFLKAVPGLEYFGFRVGESGRPESFFRDAYLAGIRESGRSDLSVYTRTWLAKKEALAEIGRAYPDFFIEIKYNGEQLGAPYHAIQTYGHSYSYQDYLTYPRDWDVVWQIRANGTHRLFPWFDPAFAAATMRSCKLGDAIGFTMEPMTAYYPQDPSLYFAEPLKHNYIHYMFERHWMWYLLWGRTAYDPGVQSDVFLNAFQEHFGKEGPNVLEMLESASTIIPTIYQYHSLGPDHRDMAPEFEVGDGRRGLEGFVKAGVLSREFGMNIPEYVDWWLKHAESGELPGKPTPSEVADILETMAVKTRSLCDVNVEAAKSNPEIADLVGDCRMLSYLALYYSEKMRAAVELELYNRTDDPAAGYAAYAHASVAIDSYWQELSRLGEERYRPLIDTLRMRTEDRLNDPDFTWSEENVKLQENLRELKALVAGVESREATPLLVHTPPLRAEGDHVTLRIGLRAVPEDIESVSVTLDNNNVAFAASRRISARYEWLADFLVKDLPAGPLPYTIRARLKSGLLTEKASVYVAHDTDPPVIASESVRPDFSAGTALCGYGISDPSGLRRVTLTYKELPTGDGHDWRHVKMEQAESGTWSAEFPLTRAGALYFVEAVDGQGNTVRLPDVRDWPPFHIIEPPK